MYLSKMQLRSKPSLQGLAIEIQKDPYRAHQHVWDLFRDRPDRQRDFLFRKDESQGWPVLYTLSERRPEDPKGQWRIQTQQFAKSFQKGQAVRFALRANPVVCNKNKKGKRIRYNVVETSLNPAINKQEGEKRGRRWEAGKEWLLTRAEKNGFALAPQEIRVDGYRKEKFFQGRKRNLITVGMMDFSGFLTVTDPERFAQTISNGLGAAKGFGCGLLLLDGY